jgi:hypothetical protein
MCRFASNFFLTIERVHFASYIIFLLSLRQLFFYCRTCLLCLENNFLITERACFALKTIFFLSNVFALLWKQFYFYLMCSLRFENNFLTIEHVRIASKLISLLSNVFALLWYRRKPQYRSFHSLSFRYRCHNYNGILWGLGETDSWKKTEVKNLVTLSL